MRKKLDIYRVVAVLFILLLADQVLAQDEGDLRYMSYPSWSQLTMDQKLSFASGVIIGQYGIAVHYITDNMDLAGKIPSLYDYMINGFSNSDLVRVVDAVYRLAANRTIPIAAIILQPQYWIDKLRIGV